MLTILFNRILYIQLWNCLSYRTDNAIKNHWNSSMRRKIEKYLAKKQQCDEANIRYKEDGRFDFMGDLEGVLAAVRGKDKSSRSRGSNSASKNSATPGSSASSIKNRSRDLDSSFLSVSTSSPISSAGKMRKDSNKYESDNRNDLNDRRNMRHHSNMFSEKNKHYASQYGHLDDNKENIADKENIKPLVNNLAVYGTRYGYDDRSSMQSSYPQYNVMRRRGANQGPYTEAIQKGSASSSNMFSFSPRRISNRDRSLRDYSRSSGREVHRTRSYDEAREVSPKFDMNMDTDAAGSRMQTDEYEMQRDKPSQNKSYRTYISVTGMETPDPESRWKNQAHTPQSTSPWRSPQKVSISASDNTHGLTPLSTTKGNWCSTPMTESLRGIFSPGMIDSNDRHSRYDESSGIRGHSIFSPSWTANSETSKNKSEIHRNKNFFSDDERSPSNIDRTAHDRPKICVSQLRIGDDNENFKMRQQALSNRKFRQVVISPISHGSPGRRNTKDRAKSSGSYFNHEVDNICSSSKSHSVTSIRSDLNLQSCRSEESSEEVKAVITMVESSSTASVQPASNRISNSSKEEIPKAVPPTPADSRDAPLESSLHSSSTPSKIDIASLMSPSVSGTRSSPYTSGDMLSGLPTPNGGSDGSAEKFWDKGIDLGFSPGEIYSPKLHGNGNNGRLSAMSMGQGSETFIDSLLSEGSTPKRRKTKVEDATKNDLASINQSPSS